MNFQMILEILYRLGFHQTKIKLSMKLVSEKDAMKPSLLLDLSVVEVLDLWLIVLIVIRRKQNDLWSSKETFTELQASKCFGLLLSQQTHATPSQQVEIFDGKVIRRQKLKESKSVGHTKAVVNTMKSTKRSAAENKTSVTPAGVPNSKKSKTLEENAAIHNVQDSRDEEIATLKSQLQFALDKLANQTSSSGQQHTSSNNVFVPPSNTNLFQQMSANQTVHQQPQQPQRQHYGAAGNCLPYNDDDALYVAFCSNNRKITWHNYSWTTFF